MPVMDERLEPICRGLDETMAFWREVDDNARVRKRLERLCR